MAIVIHAHRGRGGTWLAQDTDIKKATGMKSNPIKIPEPAYAIQIDQAPT
jgi:hypothetical protein